MAGADDIEARVEAGFSGVDEEFARIHQAIAAVVRSSQIDRGFADQRRLMDFAFNTLRSEMHERFGRLERKIDWIVDHLSNRR